MTNEELEKELRLVKIQCSDLKKSLEESIKLIHDFFSQHAGLIQNNTDNIEKMADSLDTLYKHIIKAIEK